VFDKRVLKRMIGRQREEVTGEWRKLHNEELHNLYYSPNFIKVIKENAMGGACSTYRRDKMCNHGFLSGNLKGREHFEDLNERIILK
jgi:hypothetical protein